MSILRSKHSGWTHEGRRTPGFGIVGSVVGIASGVNSLFGGGGGGGDSSTYDPYAPYRGAAAEKLNSLMFDPSSVYAQPGFQGSLEQGIKTSQRGAAATGNLMSGGESASLFGIGQNTFNSYYNNMMANLMQMSGASASPSAAGQAQASMIQANSNANQRSLTNIAGGMGGLQSWYSSPSSSYNAGSYSTAGSGNFGTGGVQRDSLGVPFVEDF